MAISRLINLKITQSFMFVWSTLQKVHEHCSNVHTSIKEPTPQCLCCLAYLCLYHKELERYYKGFSGFMQGRNGPNREVVIIELNIIRTWNSKVRTIADWQYWKAEDTSYRVTWRQSYKIDYYIVVQWSFKLPIVMVTFQQTSVCADAPIDQTQWQCLPKVLFVLNW